MPAKDKLNTIEVLISKALIDSYIVHDGFASVKNVLGEYDDMKEAIKNPKTSVIYRKLLNIYKTMLLFINKQEACELLSNLGIRTPLSIISLLGDILF